MFDNKSQLELKLECIYNAYLSENIYEELYLNYQPIIDLVTGDIIGYEALLRWHNEFLGDVSPDNSIQIAEEYGFICKITKFVVRLLQGDMERYPEFFHEKSIHINVSVLDMISNKSTLFLMNKACELISYCKKVILEITETSKVSNIGEMCHAVNKLKDSGYGIIVDDFGSGHSAFEKILCLDVDGLKIDKTINGHLESSGKVYDMLDKLHEFSKLYNFVIICEGIEEEETDSLLIKLGFKSVQGYFYMRPARIESHLQIVKC